MKDYAEDHEQTRVALYVRVSTNKQVERELPLEAQLRELRKHAHEQGWVVVAEFVEKGQSATNDDRPEFQRMVAMAREDDRPFDVILVWDFSRFARSRKISIVYKEFLRRHDVRVVSMRERVDDSPEGEMVEGLFELVDEAYSKRLAQATKRGMRLNAERGFRNGGGTPIGFKLKKVNDGGNMRSKLEPDEMFAPIIRRIFRMYREGSGVKAIASALNSEGVLTNTGKPFNTMRVNRILRDEIYVGTSVWNRTSTKYGKQKPNKPKDLLKVPNSHDAIIDQETFDTVQQLLDARNPKMAQPRAVGSKQLLSELLFCGLCGSSMSGYPAKSGKYHYYTCNAKKKRGVDECSSRSIDKEKFDQYLIEKIRSEVLTDDNVEHLVRVANDEIGKETEVNTERLHTIDQQLAEAKRRLDNLLDAIENGVSQAADLGERVHERKTQYDRLVDQKRDIERKLSGGNVEFINRAAILAYVDNLRDLLDKGTPAERRAFLKSFVKRIDVYPDEVKVEYRIPVGNKQVERSLREVLPSVTCGGAYGI